MTSIDALKKRLQQAYYSNIMKPGQIYTVDDRVEDLKQDPEFAGLSDEELYDYVDTLISKENQIAMAQFVKGIHQQLGIPADGEWSQYTYEEILQMEDNGVLIPDEVLKWAHSMQASNVSEYELTSEDTSDINDTDSTKNDVGDAGNMGLANVAKVFTKKVVLQEEILDEAEREFSQYSTQLETNSDDALAVQNNALKEIQSMRNEWQRIDSKIKNGDELSADEQARYGELGVLMNNVVNNSTMQISSYMSDFDEISKLMQNASKEAKVAQDYANDTSFTGSLIAEYEAAPKSSVNSKYTHTYTGAAGVVDLIKSNALGKNLSVAAVQLSGHLQNTAFDTDKSIKEVSEKMTQMTGDVDAGSRNISLVVSESESKTSSAKPQTEETPPAEMTPESETQPVPPVSEEDEQNKNVFAEQEDFNDIDSIIKRQQKQAPEQTPQDIIVDN